MFHAMRPSVAVIMIMPQVMSTLDDNAINGAYLNEVKIYSVTAPVLVRDASQLSESVRTSVNRGVMADSTYTPTL